MTDEVLYSGTLDKKARSTVFLGRRWVTRTMKLLRSKKIEYYDGDTRRGEISLQGPVSIVEKSMEEADGMNHAFEISNSIKNDKPLLVSAPSAIEKEKWIKHIRRTITGDIWGSAATSERIAEVTESLPFVRKKENDFDYDLEAQRVLEEFRRNYIHMLDQSMLANVSKVSTVLDHSERTRSIAVGKLGKSLSQSRLPLSYIALRKQCRERGESEFTSLAVSGDVLRTQRSEQGFSLPQRILTDDTRISMGSASTPEDAIPRKLKVVEEVDSESARASSPKSSSGHFDGNDLENEERDRLFECCEEGNVELLQQMCESQARGSGGGKEGFLECCNSFGVGPVHVAAASGSLSCLRLLLDKKNAEQKSKKQQGRGSDASPGSTGGLNPLHMAASWGQSEALLMLLERCLYGDSNTWDHTGRNPLHVAASAGQAGAMEVLLKRPECDPNEKSADGISPLLFAVSSGSVEAVRLLLCNKADISQADTLRTGTGGSSTHFTINALHLAAEYGNVNVLQVLRDCADPALLDSVREDVGWTAAHYSAYANSPACLQMCIASGLSALTGRLSSSSSSSSSELPAPAPAPAAAPVGASLARERTSSDTPTELDDSHISNSSENSSSRVRVPPSPITLGNTPLHVACFYGNSEVVSLLLQIPESALSCRHLHSPSNHTTTTNDGNGGNDGDSDADRVDTVSGLAADSCGVMRRDKAHDLHVTAMLTMPDSLGRSALHFCAMGDQINLLDSLMSLGAPLGVGVHIEDSRGHTPFFVAIMYARERAIYHFVHVHGESLEERSARCGMSPLELASMYGVRHIIGGITGRDEQDTPPSTRTSFIGYSSNSNHGYGDVDKATKGYPGSISPPPAPSDKDEEEGERGASITRGRDEAVLNNNKEEGEDADMSPRDSIPTPDDALRATFQHAHERERETRAGAEAGSEEEAGSDIK